MTFLLIVQNFKNRKVPLHIAQVFRDALCFSLLALPRPASCHLSLTMVVAGGAGDFRVILAFLIEEFSDIMHLGIVSTPFRILSVLVY